MFNRSYDREAVLAYAKTWAMRRNPRYADFTQMVGDCTNFVSQCIYAGAGVMNPEPVFGWYYRGMNDRAPAWTGVDALCRFLTGNRGLGPFAKLCDREELQVGDVIQLQNREGRFYHGLVVVSAGKNLLVAAHDDNAWMRPLYSYDFWDMRCLKILGIRAA